MPVTLETVKAPIATKRQELPPGELRIAWLGQAGFLLEGAGLRIVIDPYLSDSLAEKYRGTEFPHLRMAPPPIAPAELADLDLVLSTHAHTDHLDPGTLPVLQERNPKCRFVVARAVRDKAVERGLDAARLIEVNAGDTLDPGGGVRIHVLPSAHEKLTQDDSGNHLFLGYLFDFGGVTLYHSGDCVPFEGQAELLRNLDARVLLLPVNGRDEYRSSHGIPGNFLLAEAIDLYISTGADYLIGHHFGLFDFNTIDPGDARHRIRSSHPGRGDRLLIAEEGLSYRFRRLP
ncbi:MBL fold metallo-hydrolase [Salinispira pacifica]